MSTVTTHESKQFKSIVTVHGTTCVVSIGLNDYDRTTYELSFSTGRHLVQTISGLSPDGLRATKAVIDAALPPAAPTPQLPSDQDKKNLKAALDFLVKMASAGISPISTAEVDRLFKTFCS